MNGVVYRRCYLSRATRPAPVPSKGAIEADAARRAGVRLSRDELANLNAMLRPGGGAPRGRLIAASRSIDDLLASLALDASKTQPAVQDLVLDLEGRGIMSPGDLEARLVKVTVAACDCKKISGPVASARRTVFVD